MLTRELADRFERTLASAAGARLAAIAAEPDNPLGVVTRDFDGITARLVTSALGHYRWFNGPSELRAGDEAQLGALADWYRAHGQQWHVRVAPVFASPALLAALAEQGLRPTGFMNVMYGVPREVALPARRGHRRAVERGALDGGARRA